MLKAARLSLLFALCALPALADGLPAEVLDHDYAGCMGNVAAQQDPERGAYCACVRDGERNWTLDTYGQMAMEAAQAQDAGHIPLAIKQLSQDCIHKVMK